MADEPIDVEPERVIEEAEAKPKKTVNVDEMGADELVQKEIELQRSKSKVGRYSYGEAKELATIQRRLYGSPKVNIPKKQQTPFEYSRNMERYTPAFGSNVRRNRQLNMEVRGKTHYESIKRFDRNTTRQHRLRRDKSNWMDRDADEKLAYPKYAKKKRRRKRRKKKISKVE